MLHIRRSSFLPGTIKVAAPMICSEYDSPRPSTIEHWEDKAFRKSEFYSKSWRLNQSDLIVIAFFIQIVFCPFFERETRCSFRSKYDMLRMKRTIEKSIPLSIKTDLSLYVSWGVLRIFWIVISIADLNKCLFDILYTHLWKPLFSFINFHVEIYKVYFRQCKIYDRIQDGNLFIILCVV